MCPSVDFLETREYPADWSIGDEAYYPVNNEANQALYQRYRELADAEGGVIFGGRLAEYRYYDMDDVIKSALECAARAGEITPRKFINCNL